MLTLHFAPNSRAGRILWLLEELALPYELNRMDFHPKDLKSDAHRARHPLGRVPVLDDGDISIFCNFYKKSCLRKFKFTYFHTSVRHFLRVLPR